MFFCCCYSKEGEAVESTFRFVIQFSAAADCHDEIILVLIIRFRPYALNTSGHTAVLATEPLQLRAPYYGTVFHRT